MSPRPFLPAGVTGILATELFDQMARPAAYMVSGALLWLMLFLVGLVFPFIMVSLLPGYGSPNKDLHWGGTKPSASFGGGSFAWGTEWPPLVLGSPLNPHRKACPSSSMCLSSASVLVPPSTLASSYLRPKAKPSWRFLRTYRSSIPPSSSGGVPSGGLPRSLSPQSSSLECGWGWRLQYAWPISPPACSWVTHLTGPY